MLRDRNRSQSWGTEARERFDADGDDAVVRVAWIRQHLPELAAAPLPGGGETVERFRLLAELTALDGSLGRLAEGHLDALAILAELADRAPAPDASCVFAVWAAHPAALEARRSASGWRLSGTKPWSSGADLVDEALVTAVDEQGVARLFLVEVEALDFADDWHPLGMRATATRTATVDVEVASAREVGGPGSYVGRPGFWHGGIGVAACWHGLAGRLADDLVSAARSGDDPHLRAAAGRAVGELAGGRALLAAAARQLDADPENEARARRLAGIVRLEVERSSRAILSASITAQGAGALCFDASHARAVADLTVYLRQLSPDRDAASIELEPPAPEAEWWHA